MILHGRTRAFVVLVVTSADYLLMVAKGTETMEAGSVRSVPAGKFYLDLIRALVDPLNGEGEFQMLSGCRVQVKTAVH
jgi:hypothetical protein